MKFEFIKMHGCSNDFVVIDNRAEPILFSPKQIIELADYKKSIGFDQLLLIEKSSSADAGLVIYNKDGSEASACGNGTRCIAKLLLDELKLEQVTIATKERVLTASIKDGLISVNMGEAKVIAEDMSFDQLNGQFIEIGNPHVVINITGKDWTENEILKYGPVIENDPRFINKTNVNFVSIVNPKLVILRTWERGAGATLACGSGACASFYALYNQGLIENGAVIRQMGGDLYLSIDNNEIQMAGDARISYYGKYAQ